ncbi:MAG: HAMP domain-containing protein, partial [Nitrospirae bacterium]|nr:HAMP domain-containing protein [Nitrospirota bacterium]
MFRVLDRLTIKKRLFLVIASILILISIMVLSIWIGFRAINHKNSIALLLEKEAVYLQAVARGLSEFIVTQGTPASVKLTEEAMGKFDETCNTLVSELGETDTAIAITEKVIPKWKKIKGAAESLLQIQRDALTDEAMIKFGRLSAEIDLLLKDTQSIAESVRKRADSDTGRILTAIAIIVVAIILAVSLLLISTYRSVSVPIKTLTEATQKIASGDLEVNIEVSSTDEIGILASAFNSMASEIKQSHEEQRMLYEKEQRKVHQMAVLQEAVSDTASDLALEPLLERQAFHAAILVK